jgi:hypothetical protein
MYIWKTVVLYIELYMCYGILKVFLKKKKKKKLRIRA